MLTQAMIQGFSLAALLIRQQRRMGQIAYRSGQHAQILLGDAGETLQTERVRGGHDAFGVQQRPVDVEELATRHLAIVRNRGKSIDVLMDDVDVFLHLIVGLRLADETFGQLLQRILLAKMRRKEQHQTQSAIDLATGLERGILLWAPLALFGIVIIRVVTIDFR